MPESCKIILNDLYSGRCRGGVQAPLILGKNRLKKSQKEEKVGLTSKTKPHPLNSGPDPSLHTTSHHCFYFVAFCKKIFVSHVLNIPYCHNLVKVASYHKTAPAPITQQ